MSLAEAVTIEPSDRDRFVSDIIAPTGVSANVVAAFEQVDRAEFAPEDKRDKAYTDSIIPLEEGATISQPTLVAQMIHLLELQGGERVLEVGTATGYQAALLSRIAQSVDTLEINPDLAQQAASNMQRLNYDNVTVHQGDGLAGVADSPPFDAIVVTAGLKSMPKKLFDQLAVGGRIIAPVGELPEESQLTIFLKESDTEYKIADVGGCAFVPLYSPEEGGWERDELDDLRTFKEVQRQEKMARRREQLRAQLVAEGGHEGYVAAVRELGGNIADIMGADQVTEAQVLDMILLFSSVGERDAIEDEELVGRDSEPVKAATGVIMEQSTEA